jgi:hypothetical protein
MSQGQGFLPISVWMKIAAGTSAKMLMRVSQSRTRGRRPGGSNR